MLPRFSINALLITIASTCACRAAVITGAPPGGPVTVHNGTFGIDVNSDGTIDLTISVQPSTSNNQVVGSFIQVVQAPGVGAYRGLTSVGENLWPLNPPDQVGATGPGGFLYSVPGLAAITTVDPYASPESGGVTMPGWADGRHHFVGVDVPSGADHHYGWVELSVQNSGVPTSASPWFDVTVYGWAHETVASQPITIPEPSTIGSIGVLVGILARCVTGDSNRAR